MKRLLTYLFLVIGLGLIISGSTFAKEKVYFCEKGKWFKGVARISTVPCNKIMVGDNRAKWKKISAKKYIDVIIVAFGSEDSVIQSLYDDFEKHNLDTDIITKRVEKEKKKTKSELAKEKEKREEYAKDDSGYDRYTGEQEGIIAMCLDEKNLNKVRVSYFNDLETYKKNGSFKKGECNYVVSRKLNLLLYTELYKKTFTKKK